MDLTKLRLLAALMHSVPDARLRLTHDSGATSIVSYAQDACLDPCHWRTLIANVWKGDVDEGLRSYADRIVGYRFERGFDPIGNVARRIHQGRAEYWFASTLRPDRLVDVFAEHPNPVPPGILETAILADTELKISVAVASEVAPCARPHLQPLAESLATGAAVTELLGEGVWVDSHLP